LSVSDVRAQHQWGRSRRRTTTFRRPWPSGQLGPFCPQSIPEVRNVRLNRAKLDPEITKFRAGLACALERACGASQWTSCGPRPAFREAHRPCLQVGPPVRKSRNSVPGSSPTIRSAEKSLASRRWRPFPTRQSRSSASAAWPG
jgi:hypothetical protein